MLNKWTFGKHVAVCLGLWLLLNIFGIFLLPSNKAISLGVIGGIDGPTTVFLSGKLMTFLSQNVFLLLLLAVTLLLYKPIKKLIEKV